MGGLMIKHTWICGVQANFIVVVRLKLYKDFKI